MAFTRRRRKPSRRPGAVISRIGFSPSYYAIQTWERPDELPALRLAKVLRHPTEGVQANDASRDSGIQLKKRKVLGIVRPHVFHTANCYTSLLGFSQGRARWSSSAARALGSSLT